MDAPARTPPYFTHDHGGREGSHQGTAWSRADKLAEGSASAAGECRGIASDSGRCAGAEARILLVCAARLKPCPDTSHCVCDGLLRPHGHSVRRAVIGSTAVARRAGNQQASSAENSSTTFTHDRGGREGSHQGTASSRADKPVEGSASAAGECRGSPLIPGAAQGLKPAYCLCVRHGSSRALIQATVFATACCARGLTPCAGPSSDRPPWLGARGTSRRAAPR